MHRLLALANPDVWFGWSIKPLDPEGEMELIVECYAGYRGEETPRRLLFGQRKIEVAEVIDRWLEPDYRYFKLMGDNGKVYLVRHDETAQRWELVREIDEPPTPQPHRRTT
jgi:hypothetical protein